MSQPFFHGLQLQPQAQARSCLHLQHSPTHLSLFPSAMNNPLFPLQWPPAPVAVTSVRLPPLAEQATIALQDPLPVAYSYGSQSKRDAAFAHNLFSCSAFSLALLSISHFKIQRPLFSVILPPLSTLFNITIFSFTATSLLVPPNAVASVPPLGAYNIRAPIRQVQTYSAFPLHGTVRFGTARYGTAQFGSVCVSTAV